MNKRNRLTWTLITGLVIIMLLGLAFSSPSPAVGQGESTPTHVPPPARTLPPGVRLTPVSTTAQQTPQPPSENPNTPTPAPVVLLPAAGSSTGGTDQDLSLVLVAGGLGLFALGWLVARRARTE